MCEHQKPGKHEGRAVEMEWTPGAALVRFCPEGPVACFPHGPVGLVWTLRGFWELKCESSTGRIGNGATPAMKMRGE